VCCSFAASLSQGGSNASVLQGSLPSQLQQQHARQQLQRQRQHSSSSASSRQAQQCSSPTTCSDLPDTLLVRVLRFVQLPLRVGRCSLVCSAWRAAAADATSTVMVRMQGARNVDDVYPGDLWELESEEEAEVVASRGSAGVLEQWLAAHGPCVNQLSIKAPEVGDSSPADALLPLQLPFEQLQQLHSFCCCHAQLQEMQLGSGSTGGLQQRHRHDMSGAVHKAPSHTSAATYASSYRSSSSSSSAILMDASLPSLTQLTSLQLRGVNYCCRGGLAALSALTGLQQLQLTEFPEHDAEQQAADHDHQHQLGYLPLLTRLTRLQLDVSLLPQGAVGVFSGLQRLQELRLEGDAPVSLDVLQGLPASVAKLWLNVSMQQPFSICTVPALVQLTALQKLEVMNCTLPDWQAGGFPVGISLDFLLGIEHPEQQEVLDLEGHMSSDPASTLMSVMPRLTNLLHMRVSRYDHVEDDLPERVSDVARYSALLPPGPHLTLFSFTASGPCMLSAGCGTHMFGHGRQLPQLKVLELGPDAFNTLDEPTEHFMYFSGAAHGGLDAAVACFGPGDVERLVCCCPALERLWLPGLVQAGVDVSAAAPDSSHWAVCWW
jgi:hypothetical protein